MKSFWQKAPRHKRIYRGPIRDKKFKVYVRTFPCLICGHSPSQAAHTGTDGGKAQKSSDRTCVNLCWRCHRQYHQIGRKSFEVKHGIDFAVIVLNLNSQYERRNMSFGQPANSIADWEHGERERERQQPELFPDYQRDETPEEREISAYYAHQKLTCGCHHILGMHDFPLGKCMEPECGCAQFEEKRYDRIRLTPNGEMKSEEAA